MKNKFSQNDYSPNALPSNRKEQFFNIFKNYWRTYLLIGVLFLAFGFPLILAIIFKSYTVIQIASSSASDEAKKEMMFLQLSIFAAIKIPCYVLLSIPLAGCSTINREICFGEPLLFKADFFKGVKQNCLHYIAYSLIIFIVIFLAKFSILMKTYTSVNGMPIILIGILFGIIFLVLIPLFSFAVSIDSIYSLKFKQSLFNAFLFMVKKYWMSLLLALPVCALFLLLLIQANYTYITLAIVLLILAFLLPIYTLIYHEYALSLFDKYMNKEHYPTIYKKGLKQ